MAEQIKQKSKRNQNRQTMKKLKKNIVRLIIVIIQQTATIKSCIHKNRSLHSRHER